MSDDRLRDRIADQFSGHGESADIWRGFERFLDTDAFLNLGYSPRFVPHVVGSSQRRLAGRVGEELADHVDDPAATTVLDVGCGRGGPAVHLADRWGFQVTGVDLVPANLGLARANAAERGVPVDFAAADATRLPVPDGSVDACTAVDSVVYMPETAAVYGEVARVLRGDGVAVVSDLLVRDGLDDDGRAAVDDFADAWDLAPLEPMADYRAAVESAGLVVESFRDISRNSVGRFRTWSGLYLALSAGGGRALDRLLARWELNPAVVERQIRHAHRALPHLRHALLVAKN